MQADAPPLGAQSTSPPGDTSQGQVPADHEHAQGVGTTRSDPADGQAHQANQHEVLSGPSAGQVSAPVQHGSADERSDDLSDERSDEQHPDSANGQLAPGEAAPASGASAPVMGQHPVKPRLTSLTNCHYLLSHDPDIGPDRMPALITLKRWNKSGMLDKAKLDAPGRKNPLFLVGSVKKVILDQLASAPPRRRFNAPMLLQPAGPPALFRNLPSAEEVAAREPVADLGLFDSPALSAEAAARGPRGVQAAFTSDQAFGQAPEQEGARWAALSLDHSGDDASLARARVQEMQPPAPAPVPGADPHLLELLASVEARMDSVESRLGGIEREVGSVASQLQEMSSQQVAMIRAAEHMNDARKMVMQKSDAEVQALRELVQSLRTQLAAATGQTAVAARPGALGGAPSRTLLNEPAPAAPFFRPPAERG